MCIFFIIFLKLNLTMSYIRDVDNNYAEGSRPAGRNDEDEDDPFTSGTSKNAMPMPPDKEKKFYLEDYENFTVK